MSKISFAEDAWNEYLYWQTQDKKTLRKINALLKDIQRTPFEGEGKPEPLKDNKSGLWSRRINEVDRLVYPHPRRRILRTLGCRNAFAHYAAYFVAHHRQPSDERNPSDRSVRDDR